MNRDEILELRRLARLDAQLRREREENRLAICEGKQRFATPAEVPTHASRNGYRAYKCGYCRGWHLGGPRSWHKGNNLTERRPR